jgi:hypothetical protein
MADIHINIRDVERIRTSIDQAEREIKQALDRIEQSLTSADWQDPNRWKFENSWKAARSKFNFDASAKDLRSELTTVITKARQMGGQ